MVQLGYNGSAIPILFFPFWNESELSFPKEGIRIDESNFQFLQNLEVASSASDSGKEEPLLHWLFQAISKQLISGMFALVELLLRSMGFRFVALLFYRQLEAPLLLDFGIR